MRKVQRSEVLDLGAYEQVRPHFRGRLIDEKQHRRIALGDHMTLIFENHDTVLLQIQEMLRTERITDERAIAHEIETYNELVPGPGELSATLMIEFDDPAERRQKSFDLAGLGDHVSVTIGHRKVQGVFRLAPGEDATRVPAINYLRFPLGAEGVQALVQGEVARVDVQHPAYTATAILPANVRAALIRDFTTN